MGVQIKSQYTSVEKVCIFGPTNYERRDAISEAIKPIRTKVVVLELVGSFVRECFTN